MAANIQNVFIAHAHEDDGKVGDLKTLLARHGKNVRDSSITADKPNAAKSPDYIKREILAPSIKWAGVVIGLVTPETKESSWVNWEIEYAQKNDKRIVAVWAYGDNNCELPESLERYADAAVAWNGQSIADALNGGRNDWQKPDGTESDYRTIRRHDCG